MSIDLTKRRTPSELRNLLEVRVRRQASSYDTASRAEALREIRELADAALADMEQRSG